MILDEFGKNLVSGFLKDVKDNGVVCKQDVLSIENQIEGIISSSINVNAFTSMKSSTNVNELIVTLESILSEQEETSPITVEEVVRNIDSLKNKINNVLSRINDGLELDSELIDNILNNHYLGKFDPADGLVDLADFNIDAVINELMEIIESLTKEKDGSFRANVLESAHDVGKALYEKPKNMFSLLRMTLKNKLTIRMEESEISDVTLRDIITEFIVNDKLTTNLLELRSEVTELQTSLLFDTTYDNNLNNDVVFTYNDLNKKIDNLRYLIDDDISTYIIRLFKQALRK